MANMRHVSMPLILLPALLLAAKGSAVGPTDQGEQIVLFGARWCGPCMAEWRNLPELARAVAPRTVTLAWVDRAIPVPPGEKGRINTMPVDQARALAIHVGGQGFGLPMAAVMRDGKVICPLWRRPLQSDNLAEFERTCQK